MKKSFLITALSFALFMNSFIVHAQPVLCDQASEEFILNDELIELIQTDPVSVCEKYSNITDVQRVSLDENVIGNYVTACEYDENGNVHSLECDAVLNKITYQNDASELYSLNTGTSTLYVLSATATSKTSEDTLDEDGVILYGCIGWEDVLGVWNQLEYVSGNRSGSYANEGKYMAYRQSHLMCSGDFETSFYDTADADDAGGTQFRLIVRSDTSSGKTVQLTVLTSVFD